eukprot:CAMPEP_0172502244 /NCGR_PEP_ID=MMETSP1066-20121228/158168_1 /TAXON_ID=671091 /ORGANISM="Coscinodiscus wailesii, Strain CCMP2513" /LENGTH=268 /DNA_ID=CAMNT_0013277431 /DNA_START=62 /DNA_END=864 /DNA_ORIENTATION=-
MIPDFGESRRAGSTTTLATKSLDLNVTDDGTSASRPCRSQPFFMARSETSSSSLSRPTIIRTEKESLTPLSMSRGDDYDDDDEVDTTDSFVDELETKDSSVTSTHQESSRRKQRHCYSSDDAISFIGPALIAAMAYFLLWITLGGAMTLPGGAVWNLTILWLSSLFGGWMAGRARLPPLLGMLFAGLLLQNLPGRDNTTWLVASVSDETSGYVRATSLAVIFLRSGLDLDLSAILGTGGTGGAITPRAVARLTFLPGLAEACIVGVTA